MAIGAISGSNKSKMAAAAILKKISKWPYLRNRSSNSLNEQIQDGRRRHLG